MLAIRQVSLRKCLIEWQGLAMQYSEKYMALGRLRRQCPSTMHILGSLLILSSGLLTVFSDAVAQVAPREVRQDQGVLRPAEVALRDARQLEVPLLAPTLFGKANDTYQAVRKAHAAGLGPKTIQARLNNVLDLLSQARERARETRQLMAEAISTRKDASRLKDLALAPNALAKAEEHFHDAIRLAERGDAKEAITPANEATRIWRQAVLDAVRQDLISPTEKELEQAARYISDKQAEATRQALTALRAWLRSMADQSFEIASLERAARERVIAVKQLFYPDSYWNPPRILRMGEFTLRVERYQSRQWDFAEKVIVGASGLAWTSFSCDKPFVIPEWDSWLTLDKRRFRIVKRVTHPANQIALLEAQRLDPSLKTGDVIDLSVPKALRYNEPVTVARLREVLELPEASLSGLLGWPKKGQILVRFENLTIRATNLPNTGEVISGLAKYPATPRIPHHLNLSIAGFSLHVDTLEITNAEARVEAVLELPTSIVDANQSQVARVPLGTVTISSSCEFYKVLPSAAFGAWTVEPGIEFQGAGIIADFSKKWSWPGWIVPPFFAPSWRGLILKQGKTVPISGPVVSNIGYLKAPYDFHQATVTAAGLSARFELQQLFQFTSAHPYGYDVGLQNGWLQMERGEISEGKFTNGNIKLPELAVSDQQGDRIAAGYQILNVQEDLDLFTEIQVLQEMFWGEFTQTNPRLKAYSTEQPSAGYFYLSASHKSTYWPFEPSGFARPILFPAETRLEVLGMQGATIWSPRRFTVFTPDTQAAKPIVFSPDGSHSWLNVTSAGVHGEIVAEAVTTSPLLLGNTARSFYVATKSFATTFSLYGKEKQRLRFRFADSAVYESEIAGSVDLAGPTKDTFSFTDMQFTSTAHNAGGKIDLSSPASLDYWGLMVMAKPGMSSAGVLSVKTGQIILTAAGLSEPRHFGEPFYLTWGELLASGDLGRLFFDYDSSGQTFDGFPYVPEVVVLSQYDSADTNKTKAHLKTAGTAHFDFFGSSYLNIHDFNNIGMLNPPFDGRRIELAFDSKHGTHPTDDRIARNWSLGFSQLDFTIKYDDGDQDGFFGLGTVGLLYVHDGALTASVNLSSDRICFSVNETTRHDFTLGPVAHFGSMSRITGCGCIEGGNLERLNLSAELEQAGNSNVLVRSAAYGKLEYSLTPTVSEMQISGSMYISVLVGGDLEATARARFAVDRNARFVEGDIEGTFGTAALLEGLSADGQLNWHLAAGIGGADYHSLQGRLALQVFAPIGGAAPEGGFYVGANAPKGQAWVLQDAGSRFKLNMAPLPDRLTGVYGYVKADFGINYWIVSGGVEVYAGFGGFVLDPLQSVSVGAQPSGLQLPYVVGNLGVNIRGEILGGLVSAGAWGNFNVIVPFPFGYEGTVGLEGCALWVICASVDVTCGLNSTEGFYLR